jgi:hypothetical protein
MGNGFVLTLRYTGQQVAGMRGMFSQQCWLNSFQLPLSIVEPFVSDSTLVHTKSLWEKEETGDQMSLRLSSFYQMRKTALSLRTWKDFMTTAPRRLIVVNVENVYARGCLNFEPKQCLTKQLGIRPLLKCKPLKMIKDSVAYLEARGFKVVRHVCFNCSAPEISDFTPNYFTMHIFGDYKPQEVTVLFSHWKFSFQLTPECAARACDGLAEVFKKVQAPSNLDRAATRYVDVIDKMQGNSGKPVAMTLAIMVRLEWFLITHRNSSLEKVDSCLQTVMERKRELEAAIDGRTRVLLALDIGKFGSGSFNKTIHIHITHDYFEKVATRVKNVVSELYNAKLDFDLWEESFVTATRHEGSADRSYIAALQGLTASRADCLVLMGGGHFQDLALQKYNERTISGKCIHKICTWK